MAAWMIRREDPGAGELGYLAHNGSETGYIGNLVAIKPRAMTTMRGSRARGDRGAVGSRGCLKAWFPVLSDVISELITGLPSSP